MVLTSKKTALTVKKNINNAPFPTYLRKLTIHQLKPKVYKVFFEHIHSNFSQYIVPESAMNRTAAIFVEYGKGHPQHYT